jgi:hypothetical protein
MRAVWVGSLSERVWPSLEQLARRPGQLPGHRFRQQDLAQILRWGTGETNVARPGELPEAIARIRTLTRIELVDAAITLEEAEEWEYAYAVEAASHPNPSAYPRSRLLRCVVKLLANPDADALGSECCQDELDYHPPVPPPRPPRGWRGRL